MSFLMRKARGAAVTVGIGALTSYFLDPQLGRQRRQDVVGRVSALLAAVREERSTTRRSAHGDGDPTGGALPSEPLPSDVLPTAPGPDERPEPEERRGPDLDLGALGAV